MPRDLERDLNGTWKRVPTKQGRLVKICLLNLIFAILCSFSSEYNLCTYDLIKCLSGGAFPVNGSVLNYVSDLTGSSNGDKK